MTESRECGTKIRHDSRRGAVIHRRALIRIKGASGALLSVYRCRHCGSWHVGNRKWVTKR